VSLEGFIEFFQFALQLLAWRLNRATACRINNNNNNNNNNNIIIIIIIILFLVYLAALDNRLTDGGEVIIQFNSIIQFYSIQLNSCLFRCKT
jgi:hypothetical protein